MPTPAAEPRAASPHATPRRVLMTTDAVGGVWTCTLDLCRGLAAHGVAVDLALMGPEPREAQRRAALALPNVRLHESRFALEWMPEPWDEVDRAGEWLLDLEARVRPDVVHLNGFAHGALPFRAPVLAVAHSCVLSWWEAVHGGAPAARWDTYADRVRRGLQAAATVAAPSRAMADAVVAHYGRPRDLRVIANGRCPDGFAPAPSKEPFVCTAGRLWDEAKNLAAVCAAAAHVSWPVLVAGDDRAPDGTRSPAGHVHQLGPLDGPALCDLFSRAAIFVLPARYEPFGLTPLEAALAGCALVLGDIRSLREVWGDAALFVPPDNRRALGLAIESLIRNPSAREALAHKARQRAERYTVENMTAGYLAAYRDLRSAPVAA